MEKSLFVFSFIVAVNILGMLYGYYYYGEQLSSSPLYLWIFIPDCPLYVMLFTAVLILTVLGIECKLLSYIAAVGMMKYGIWTVLALLMFGDYFFYGSLLLTSSALFVLHIGMFAEGPLLIPRRLSRNYLIAGLLWFLANDYVDYFYVYLNRFGEYVVGTHPLLPAPGRMPLMMVVTIMLSLLMCIFAYLFSSSSWGWSFRKEVEEAADCFQNTREKRNGRRRRKR